MVTVIRTTRDTENVWLTLPLVAVTVRTWVLTGTVVPVLIVMIVEPAPATVHGLKLAEAPAGKPATEKLTVPPKPLREDSESEYAAVPPAGIAMELGLAATLKSWTTSDAAAGRTRAPLEAWTLSVDVPTGVPVVVVTVIVVKPAPDSVAGVNVAVAPAGSPKAKKLTEPANPSNGETITL